MSSKRKVKNFGNIYKGGNTISTIPSFTAGLLNEAMIKSRETMKDFKKDVLKSYQGFVKPDRTELEKKLDKLQFAVTQKDATENPHSNAYCNNKEPGIYVDIISGEPLFSSLAKYDSGTGWPSFWEPLHKELIVEKIDKKLFSTRTEVRSKFADSHLGHVFNDGPKPTGLRYCMNSAAMRFIPKSNLTNEGYGAYLELFKD